MQYTPLFAGIICIFATILYINNMVPYRIIMPIIVACLGMICLWETVKFAQEKFMRNVMIFGIAALLCFAFVIGTVLGII